MQLIASFFIAPLFATFLLGMFWRRANATGAFYGMIAGIAGSGGHYIAYRAGIVHYSTQMAANFYGAITGWTAAMIVTISLSLLTAPPPDEKLGTLVYGKQTKLDACSNHWYSSVEFQGACILTVTLLLNIYFW